MSALTPQQLRSIIEDLQGRHYHLVRETMPPGQVTTPLEVELRVWQRALALVLADALTLQGYYSTSADVGEVPPLGVPLAPPGPVCEHGVPHGVYCPICCIVVGPVQSRQALAFAHCSLCGRSRPRDPAYTPGHRLLRELYCQSCLAGMRRVVEELRALTEEDPK